MGKRALKGQITVFASLIFGLVAALLVVMIESAVCTGAKTRIQSIVNTGVQSLFSQYSIPLLENYEIFGGVISDEKEIVNSLNQSLYENCTSKKIFAPGLDFDPFGIRLSETNLYDFEMLTDKNGENFYDEIIEYMKYGKFDDSLMDFVPDMLESARQKSVDEVREELTDRQKEAGKIDSKILKLLTLVEGVKTNAHGFQSFLGNLRPADAFVKRICVKGTEFGMTGVDNHLVYDAVEKKYYDILSELNGLKADLDYIVAVYNNPITKGVFVDTGYRMHALQILSVVNETLEKVNRAQELIAEIEKDTGQLMEHLNGSEKLLAQRQVDMTEEVSNAFRQEFTELRKYETGEANQLCNISVVKTELITAGNVLLEMQTAISSLQTVSMDIDSIGNVYSMIDSAVLTCQNYNAAQIQFQYSGVTLGRGKSLEVIEKIKDVFTNNILALTIDDTSRISTKKVSFTDLSSMTCGTGKGAWKIILDPESLYQDFLYNRYVSLHCSCYTNPSQNGALEYEMEYILGKKKDDKSNLKETLSQLLMIRFLSNFTYIICDVEKKQECLQMSTALLGFTGVYGIIKAGQFLLLTAWAYGEGINDIRILLEKGKVPFQKSKETWKTNLDDIVESKVCGGEKGEEQGLSYEEYLQLLLFLRDRESKIFRTMDVMEMNLICQGYSHVRMYRYLYSVKGASRFLFRNGNYQYEQKFEFHY